MKNALITATLSLAVVLAGCADEPDLADSGVEPVGADDAAVGSDFNTLDTSGDSYLDTDEVAEWVDDSGTFEEWDADADSELDADELAGNAFQLWDSDDNGTVSEEEWKTGTDLWYTQSSNVAVFSDWDGDGDSELDEDEFTERWDASLMGEQWTTIPMGKDQFKANYFSLYDADDDGKVTEEEWRDGAASFGAADDVT